MSDISTTEHAPTTEVVVYQPNETVRLDVRFDGETVWLNRQQMAQLFGRDIKTIGKHIANALSEELRGLATVAKFATVQIEGGRRVIRQIEHYGLDMILSVGYRVKSPQGILFRRWANEVLREMLLNKLEEVKRIAALENRMDRAETSIKQVEAGVSYLVQQLSTPPPDPPRRKIGFSASGGSQAPSDPRGPKSQKKPNASSQQPRTRN